MMMILMMMMIMIIKVSWVNPPQDHVGGECRSPKVGRQPTDQVFHTSAVSPPIYWQLRTTPTIPIIIINTNTQVRRGWKAELTYAMQLGSRVYNPCPGLLNNSNSARMLAAGNGLHNNQTPYR